jgi:DNA-directed RNA polymerase subunit H
LSKDVKKKDVTFEHELVPKHSIITKKDLEILLKKYHIQPYQLPSIRISDPAVQAIEAKPGDVIKIIRRSSTAGEISVYRYVIED